MNKIKLISFDCYGTLIDWKTSVVNTLKTLFDDYLIDISEEEIFKLFLGFDENLVKADFMFYRSMLREILKLYAKTFNINFAQDDLECLVRTLPSWKPFPDTVNALKIIKQNYKIAIISNIDRDLLDKSLIMLDTNFDYIITSDEVKSYKPSLNNFTYAFRRFNLPSQNILHVAQSRFHDIIPSNELGIKNVWINRYAQATSADPQEIPAAEFPDLISFARQLPNLKI
jgi:2-haloacid dehalogenase